MSFSTKHKTAKRSATKWRHLFSEIGNWKGFYFIGFIISRGGSSILPGGANPMAGTNIRFCQKFQGPHEIGKILVRGGGDVCPRLPYIRQYYVKRTHLRWLC